jgi:hypothetical protein
MLIMMAKANRPTVDLVMGVSWSFGLAGTAPAGQVPDGSCNPTNLGKTDSSAEQRAFGARLTEFTL